MKTTTFQSVTSFCKEIKEMAKKYKDFDSFFEATKIIGKQQCTLRKDEFNRLVQVAAVEANLA